MEEWSVRASASRLSLPTYDHVYIYQSKWKQLHMAMLGKIYIFLKASNG